jgi:hypothetical protein
MTSKADSGDRVSMLKSGCAFSRNAASRSGKALLQRNSERKPGTRAKVQRRVSQDEWHVAEHPDTTAQADDYSWHADLHVWVGNDQAKLLDVRDCVRRDVLVDLLNVVESIFLGDRVDRSHADLEAHSVVVERLGHAVDGLAANHFADLTREHVREDQGDLAVQNATDVVLDEAVAGLGHEVRRADTNGAADENRDFKAGNDVALVLNPDADRVARPNSPLVTGIRNHQVDPVWSRTFRQSVETVDCGKRTCEGKWFE